MKFMSPANHNFILKTNTEPLTTKFAAKMNLFATLPVDE